MADSVGFVSVPQVLTKNAEDFLWAALQCEERGYTEVNLNLGCPSGTVVSKGKGSGMLADPGALERFLDKVCSESPIPVSVKTRVGVLDADNFPRLMQIYNDHPLKELIIHPRARKDFYKPPLRMEAFDYAVQNINLPLCYNGDICSKKDLERIGHLYPDLCAVMIGRGLIADPGMLTPGGTDAKTLEAFHDELLEEYTACFGSVRNAMFRMKENWHYLQGSFDGGEKLFKQLRKTTDLQEYKSLTGIIFRSIPLRSQAQPIWM